MKKTYTKPESKIINVIVEGMMAASADCSTNEHTDGNWSNEREDWSSEIWSDEEGM